MSDRNGAFDRNWADRQNVQISAIPFTFWRSAPFEHANPWLKLYKAVWQICPFVSLAAKLSRLGTFGAGDDVKLQRAPMARSYPPVDAPKVHIIEAVARWSFMIKQDVANQRRPSGAWRIFRIYWIPSTTRRLSCLSFCAIGTWMLGLWNGRLPYPFFVINHGSAKSKSESSSFFGVVVVVAVVVVALASSRIVLSTLHHNYLSYLKISPRGHRKKPTAMNLFMCPKTSEGYFSSAAGVFLGTWFYVFQFFLIFCICFSAFLLLCFHYFSAFPASLLFLLLCFSCFSAFCFPCFFAFPLLCFPCFSAFVLLCLSTSTILLFLFLQSCVFSALLPAPLLPVFTVSLFFIVLFVS